MASCVLLPNDLQAELICVLLKHIDEHDGDAWNDIINYLLVDKFWNYMIRRELRLKVSIRWLLGIGRDGPILSDALKQHITGSKYSQASRIPPWEHDLHALAFISAARGLTSCLQQLLDAGIRPYARNPLRRPLLHLAIESGNLESVQLLLSSGVDVDCRASGDGITAPITSLAVAVQRHKVKIAEELLRNGASTEGGTFCLDEKLKRATNGQMLCLLQYCGLTGDIAMMALLLRTMSSRDGRKTLPLTRLAELAVKNGHEEIFDLVMSYGVKAWDCFLDRPYLVTAIKSKQQHMVRKLLKLGVEVDETGSETTEALTLAIEVESKDMTEVLLDYGAPVTTEVLRELSWKPRALIELVLSRKPHVCREALIQAALYGSADYVQACIDHGAQPNVHLRGQPLLSVVTRSRAVKICQTLLEAGADVNPHMNEAQDAMPIFQATCRNSIEHLDLLVKHGATLDLCPLALLEAARRGYAKVTRWLLDHGADPNYRGGPNNETALETATRMHLFGVIRTLKQNQSTPADIKTIVFFAHMQRS